MKPLIPVVVLAVLFAPTTVSAQHALSRLAGAEGHPVFVIDLDSREWQGTLVKASKETLTIASESGTREFQLANVKRVDADGDGIRDGVIKGAVFGLVLGLVTFGADRRALGGPVVYGLLGATMDALNHCKQTVYRAAAPQAKVTVSW